jgi:DNA-directed RNA polymerase subunit RPC12/RpoP
MAKKKAGRRLEAAAAEVAGVVFTPKAPAERRDAKGRLLVPCVCGGLKAEGFEVCARCSQRAKREAPVQAKGDGQAPEAADGRITCPVCGWKGLRPEAAFVVRAFSPDGDGARAAALRLARKGAGDRVCARCSRDLRAYEGIVVVPSPERLRAVRARSLADFVSARMRQNLEAWAASKGAARAKAQAEATTLA